MKREIPQEVQAFGQLKTKFCQKHNKIIFEVIFGKLLNFVGVLSQCFNSKLNQFFSKIAVIHIAESKSSRPDMFVKKMFSEISQNSQENSFLISCRPRPGTLLKKRLWHRRFPVSLAKFLGTPFRTPPMAAFQSRSNSDVKQLFFDCVIFCNLCEYTKN